MHGMIGIRPATTVATIEAATGLHAATVDTPEGVRIFPGYLTGGDALAAGRRFALALGVADCGPPVDSGFALDSRTGRHGDGRRRDRRAARAVKRAWLDSGA